MPRDAVNRCWAFHVTEMKLVILKKIAQSCLRLSANADEMGVLEPFLSKNTTRWLNVIQLVFLQSLYELLVIKIAKTNLLLWL